MKFNSFLIGIFLGFLPNIIGFSDNLDSKLKIVLQMLITMIFFWVTEAIPLSSYGFNTNINLTIFIRF